MMKDLLGSEFPDFLNSLEKKTIGLRTNTLKISPESLKALLPYPLQPTPWSSSGFWFDEAEDETNAFRPGRHPYHAAGLYYLQDPSAMAVAELLQPQPGELVLDLCAAPGGKSSHLAGLMAGKGALVANEVHPRRVWELAGNLERLGVRRVAVTNETPERLSQFLGPIFDRVLVDAPCSGEAMFAQSEAARRDWSMNLVRSSSLRQERILEAAAGLVRPGGILAYSTCTFNPVENEAVIARFLMEHTHFHLLPIDPPPGCSAGRPDWLDKGLAVPGIEHTIRIWPHLAPGQGHFIAVLGSDPGEHVHGKRDTSASLCPKDVYDQFLAFCSETLDNTLPENDIGKREPPGPHLREIQGPTSPPWLDKDRLRLEDNQLYWIPPEMPELSGLRTIRPGWWLGTVHAGSHNHRLRFEPAHAMAMGLTSREYYRSTAWRITDPQVIEYITGKTLDCRGEDGWSLITIDGYAMGWGKLVDQTLKNHYPRGLRWN